MASRQYVDFDVLMRQVGDAYEGRVVESPVGETAEVRFAIPFNDLDLERFLLRIGHARRKVRGAEAQKLAEIRDFGGALFDAVFKDQIGTCLRRSLDRANGEGKGLRIRLRLPNNRLADVPWEFLYDRSAGHFLCLSEWTPVVRYMELTEATPRVPVDGPLRMLVIISSPGDYPSLDVDHEWENLRSAVSGLVSSGRLEVERLERSTLNHLQRRLRQADFHVLHYIGHGGVDRETGEGMLVLEDEAGMSRLESGRDLSTLLYDERSMQLAVLNSCEGARSEGTDPFAGTAQALVQQGVAAVLAMQFEITDESAITFAHDFYEALADGYPVDAATNAARRAVFSRSRTEWGTPVLYMRGADGEIFRGVTPRLPVPDAAVPQPRDGEGSGVLPGVPMAAAPLAAPAAPPSQAQPVASVPAASAVAGATATEDATAAEVEVRGAAGTPAPAHDGGSAGPEAAPAPTVPASRAADASPPGPPPAAPPGDGRARPSGADAVAAARQAWEDTHPGASAPTATLGALGPVPTREPGAPDRGRGEDPPRADRRAPQPPHPHPQPAEPTSPGGPPAPPSRPEWTAPGPKRPKRRLPAWLLLVIGAVLSFGVLAGIGALIEADEDGGGAAQADPPADPGDPGDGVVDDGGDPGDGGLDANQVATVEQACSIRQADFATTVPDGAESLVSDPATGQEALEALAQTQQGFLGVVDSVGADELVQFAREDEQAALDLLVAAGEAHQGGDADTAQADLDSAVQALLAAQEEWGAINVSCPLG